MLDIKFIRENPDIVKKNIKKKFQDEKLAKVDEILAKDRKYRELLQEAEMLRAKRNKLTSGINELKKKGKNAAPVIKEAKELPQKIKDTEEYQNRLKEEIDSLLLIIPNMIHESVPIGRTDKDNVASEFIGKPKKFNFEVKSHVELAEALGGADFESSARTSGNGFYYLQGELALLNQALIRFGIDKMVSKGFTYVETPLMLNREVIKAVTDLKDMQSQIYKIDGEHMYLIGTSEHSLIGRYINAVIPENNLPVMNTSYSMCFRKEIGSHGIDQKGFYRTHQFNKVEMVVLCRPSESYKFYDKMLGITKEIFKELEIPIRVLEICSGDLGDLKAKSADVEAWSPRKMEYFEVGSCSNLTDCQARRLNIKYTDGKEKEYVHTLNNTAIATSRALVAILENFQNKDGSVDIPKALQKYMNGIKKITAK